MGALNYSIVSENLQCCQEHLLKVKGLTQTSVNCSEKKSVQKLTVIFQTKDFKMNFHIFMGLKCDQKLTIKKKKGPFNQILTRFDFTNEIRTKRYVQKGNEKYETHAYGFKFL